MIATLLAVAPLSWVVPQGPTSTELEGEVVEVPVDLSNDSVGIEVYVGGGGPYRFQLDTYAVTTACVDQAFAERLEFPTVGTVQNGDGSGRVVRRDVVALPILTVGGAHFEGVRALVDDYSWVAPPGEPPIDGLLGYHLFRELLLELDYPGSRVVLSRGSLDADAEHVIQAVALKTRPDIRVHIGGTPLTVGIDSGAGAGLSLPLRWMGQLATREPPVVVGRARTVYSEGEILEGELTLPLRLAGHQRDRVHGTFSELFGKPLLGHRILRHFAVTFDQRNGRVRFLVAGGGG